MTTETPAISDSYAKYLKRRSNPEAVRHDADQALICAREMREAKRLTGGRLTRDPRKQWRGGRMAVDRNNLWMLLHGIIDSPSTGERLAAMTRFDGMMIESDSWFELPHVITKTEMAAKLGVTLTGVRSLRNKRIELASQRKQRRDSDAEWKKAVAEAAVGRKERVRADHEMAHREKALRRVIWEHRQTLRRMKLAREQARRG